MIKIARKNCFRSKNWLSLLQAKMVKSNNEGSRNTLTKSQIRYFSDPAAQFTEGRILAEVNSTNDFVNLDLKRGGCISISYFWYNFL